MQRKDDILWKVVLEEVFDDLLRFVFPEAENTFNLKRGFDFLDKELAEISPKLEQKSETRFVDKLVKVHWKGGGSQWMLVHIEIQGSTKSKDREAFGKRMFQYFYRILDNYGKPVTAVAIFTGPDGRLIPGKFEYEWLGTRLSFEYNILRVLDYSDQELEKSDNPFAVVLRVAMAGLKEKKWKPERMLDEKLSLARALFAKGFSKQKVWAIFKFLEGYVRLNKSGMNRTFKERIEPQYKSNVMGIEEYVRQDAMKKGLAKGRREERRALVENLLAGTEYSVQKIAELANVSEDFVNKVKNSVKAK